VGIEFEGVPDEGGFPEWVVRYSTITDLAGGCVAGEKGGKIWATIDAEWGGRREGLRILLGKTAKRVLYGHWRQQQKRSAKVLFSYMTRTLRRQSI